MTYDITNPQSVFDHVVSSIIVQGKPSIGTITRFGKIEVTCKYRGENGAKCAAGHLIPDAKYTPEIEGLASYTPQVQELIGVPDSGPIAALINQLQGAHDRAASEDGTMEAESFAKVTPEQFVESFKTKAQKVAVGFELNASVAQ